MHMHMHMHMHMCMHMHMWAPSASLSSLSQTHAHAPHFDVVYEVNTGLNNNKKARPSRRENEAARDVSVRAVQPAQGERHAW